MKLRWSERLSFEYSRHDPVRHPAGLFAEDSEKFLICAYISIFGRMPDAAGFEAYTKHLSDGLRRWRVVDAFTHAAEYRKKGSAWLYGGQDLLSLADENWQSQIELLNEFCPGKLRDDLANFRYWDLVQMDRYKDRLNEIIHR
jgi:hypothetical protein